jgi:hypothetical protein
MKPYSTYCDQHYSPVAGGALPDTEYLAALGDRLMFRHGSATRPKLALFVAPRGILHAGWVIGVFDEPFHTLEGEEKAETMKAKSGARYPFNSLGRARLEEDVSDAMSGVPLSCGICGGHHDQPQRHKWENDQTTDALTYGDIRTER